MQAYFIACVCSVLMVRCVWPVYVHFGPTHKTKQIQCMLRCQVLARIYKCVNLREKWWLLIFKWSVHNGSLHICPQDKNQSVKGMYGLQLLHHYLVGV